MVAVYCKNDKGVDKLDQYVGYHTHGHKSVKSLKWYRPIVTYLVEIAMANAWILYEQVCPRNKTQPMELSSITKECIICSSRPRKRIRTKYWCLIHKEHIWPDKFYDKHRYPH